MKRTETVFIEVEGKSYPFRFSILSYLTYQSAYGKEITECKTMQDQLNYFNCAYVSGCNFEGIEAVLSAEDLVNLVDEYPEIITTLANAMLDSTKKK